MSKRTLGGLIAIILIIGAVIWFARTHIKNPEIIGPILSVSAFDQTRNIDIMYASVQAQDVVVYTLTAENKTDKIISGYVIEAKIDQVTDKAVLLDAQGASYNSANNSLVWTPLDIPATGFIQKKFTVRVNPLAVGGQNPVMRITFNNQLNIPLTKPHIAGAATQNSPVTPYKAPVTGPALNIIFILAFLTTGGTWLACRNIKTLKDIA